MIGSNERKDFDTLFGNAGEITELIWEDRKAFCFLLFVFRK